MSKLLAAMIGVTFCVTAEASAIGYLTMQVPASEPIYASPGNYNITYTAPQQWIVVWNLGVPPSHAAPTNIQIWGDQCFGSGPISFPPPVCNQDNDFILGIGTGASNQPLTIGTYNNAVRDTGDFPNEPFLNWAFRHYGPDNILGSFTLSEFEYHFDASHEPVVDLLDVSFVVHPENTGPAITGQFFYEANAVPEPKTASLAVAALAMAVAFKCLSGRRRNIMAVL